MDMEHQIPEMDPEELLTPDELVEKYNPEVAGFFNANPIEGIELKVFETKSELWDYYTEVNSGKIPEGYVVAFSPENLVAIIGPEGMPPDSDPGPLRFRKVLKHEIVHKYMEGLKTEEWAPAWLVEGTCCHVAGQRSKNSDIDVTTITMKLLDELTKTRDGRKYRIGRNLVDEIVRKFGKEKIIELFELPSKKERDAELKRMFEWLK